MSTIEVFSRENPDWQDAYMGSWVGKDAADMGKEEFYTCVCCAVDYLQNSRSGYSDDEALLVSSELWKEYESVHGPIEIPSGVTEFGFEMELD